MAALSAENVQQLLGRGNPLQFGNIEPLRKDAVAGDANADEVTRKHRAASAVGW